MRQKKMSTVLIALDPNNVSEKLLQRIKSLQPEAHVVVTEQREEIEQLLDQIEIAAGHFPIQWIVRAPKLRWFQQWGAGTDWLLHHPEIAQKDFILTNASGVHAVPISEHILAFLLAFARHLPQAIRAQDERRWDRGNDTHAFELCGKTMLLVGVGAIGRRTAQIAAALGMRVLGVRRDASKNVPGIDQMLGPDDLETALPEADFVVLTMPLTEETRDMFNERLFEKMKSTAYLINIGRGGTVDESALVRALLSGQIAGAGLDVFATEPLPPESPLWGLPNVIVTGHYSGDTPHYDERALEIFVDNLERYSQDQPMRNVVDKQLGY
jgi:phosphoglycerate dehydrogenase-like enzyme